MLKKPTAEIPPRPYYDYCVFLMVFYIILCWGAMLGPSAFFCDTPNEKSDVLKNDAFRLRGVAKMEKMSATLGEKQKKKRFLRSTGIIFLTFSTPLVWD